MDAKLAREVCGAHTLVCCGHRPINADSQPAGLILVPVTRKVICLLDPGKDRLDALKCVFFSSSENLKISV